jgi:hypothetical protein
MSRNTSAQCLCSRFLAWRRFVHCFLHALAIVGRGKEEVSEFYQPFVSQIPSDTEIVPVSRTLGQGRVVEEFILRFAKTKDRQHFRRTR